MTRVYLTLHEYNDSISKFLEKQGCADENSSLEQIKKIVNVWRNVERLKTDKDKSKKRVSTLIFEDNFGFINNNTVTEFWLKKQKENTELNLLKPTSNMQPKYSISPSSHSPSPSPSIISISTNNDTITDDDNSSDDNYDGHTVPNNISNIIDLEDTDNMWILPSGINFSVPFISRRNDLIQQCETNQEELQVDEELSVNGIILLDADLISNIVKEDLLILRVYYYLLNESTVVKDSIAPFLENYFPNTKKITAFGADKDIPESRKRFIAMDPSLSGHVRKADFSIVSNSSNHLILALESKSVKSQNKSANDLIKMARYMKDTIDDIESDEFKTVSIIGIIASGKTISTYVMTHSHDYLYYFYKLAKTYIPTDYHDMCRIIPIFSVLEQLKNIVTETSDILSTPPHNRATENNLKKLKTYHTPIIIPKERIKRVNLNTDDARRAR
ncbi:hypothetical protein BDF21DRAFT_404370 [Thamnidium elegans]|nr:hypothetical protein BDF21DRAFT_404370 [Thamnidium elegans]